ncbi:MAG: DNA topology modulation protein [Methylobacterium sp.]|nr:DNA topology modulation protein [Methylobacterium sp.]MCA3603842.1 DNA topology modulation protein [Methylobacterium sp.]MCA3614071.1 DNA topology modulation protein [Methylobacterium sp.]MCA3642399.1 DNA topology modulation protein [Methylobacterium sp.]MCA4910806.1 DNA topology modulation protein [Methylobacterium sp.]
MPRILVMGCSGSGKSTFAQGMSRITAIPYISLDAHFWKPGWVETDRAEFRARMAPILATENWILDGNYLSALDGAQIPRATHVFLFDLPRWQCLLGVLRRVASQYGRVRPEMAPGCPEKLDGTFLRYIWDFREKQLPKIREAISGLRADQHVETCISRAQVTNVLTRVAREGFA